MNFTLRRLAASSFCLLWLASANSALARAPRPFPSATVSESSLGCAVDRHCETGAADGEVEARVPGSGAPAKVAWRILQPRLARGGDPRTRRAFLYRIEIPTRSITGPAPGTPGCIESFAIEGGASALRLDLDGDGMRNERAVVLPAGRSDVAPSNVRRERRRLVFEFSPPLCPGERSAEFGLVSLHSPGLLDGVLTGGGNHDGDKSNIPLDLPGPKKAAGTIVVDSPKFPNDGTRIPLGCGHNPLDDPHLLDCWLAAHKEIQWAMVWDVAGPGYNAEQWSDWTEAMRQDVRDAFLASWRWQQSGFTTYFWKTVDEPPVNLEPLPPEGSQNTVLSSDDAWTLYAQHLGHSLAAEVFAWLPWSLTSLSQQELYRIVNGTAWIQENPEFVDDSYHATSPGYVVYAQDSTPASPLLIWNFLRDNDILRDSQAATVERLLDWSRDNLSHYLGGYNRENLENIWGYSGHPPVARVISGTEMQADLGWGILQGPHHWTAGCHGTTDFLRNVLRVANIPVKRVMAGGHTMPYFPTLHAYLSHGDDPYDGFSIGTPEFPAGELLISEAKWADWFLTDGLTAEANVGRRPLELSAKYLTNALLSYHCQDVIAGSPHAAGLVATKLAVAYSVPELEAMDLWTKLDAKIPGATVWPCGYLQ